MRVVLLDLDHTIVGDVAPQLTEYEVLLRLDGGAPTPAHLAAFRASLDGALRDGLLRPGFGDALRGLQDANMLAFVYTSAEAAWAELVVAGVERVTRRRLARPLFTRRDCITDPAQPGAVLKSVVHIRRALQAAVARRARGPAALKAIEDIVLIDNAPEGVVSSPEWRVVPCPAYACAVVTDPLALVLQPREIRADHARLSALMREVVPGRRFSSRSPDKFLADYHAWLASRHALAHEAHKRCARDHFWRRGSRVRRVLSGRWQHF